MKKDFLKWHDKKKSFEKIFKQPFFHEREIWFCSLGENVGDEQDGKGDDFLRPVIILRKFNQEIFWCIPLTHTAKLKPYYFPFRFGNKESVAILSQIRLLDGRRLSHKIGEMSGSDFYELKKKLTALLP